MFTQQLEQVRISIFFKFITLRLELAELGLIPPLIFDWLAAGEAG